MTPMPVQLKSRPAVHQLCYGSFLQQAVEFNANLLAMPLKDFGLDSEAEYLRLYASQVLGTTMAGGVFEELQKQGANALPVMAIVYVCPSDGDPKHLEDVATPHLNTARNVLSWNSGGALVPFAILILTKIEASVRLVRPRSGHRYKFMFGDNEFQRRVQQVMVSAEKDGHLAFLLSLFHDALQEADTLFRIARLFSCLEGFAYKLKSRDIKSRNAIRELLGYMGGCEVREIIDGKERIYDPIEIGGRVRDKFFHGVSFEDADLLLDSQFMYREFPWLVALKLQDFCESEIEGWAHGISKGLKANRPASNSCALQ